MSRQIAASKPVRRRSNGDEEYQRLARGESDSYLMVIQAEPDKGIPDTVSLGYEADHGTITKVWTGEHKTDFVLSGRYGVWVRILTGDLDPKYGSRPTTGSPDWPPA